MSDFKDAYKKKLFTRWNKLSKDLTKLILELDKENARPILEEISFILVSYPDMESFMREYDAYLTSKETPSKSVSKKSKEKENNVISIFDFKSKKSDKDE
jgi:hypothetical protein